MTSVCDRPARTVEVVRARIEAAMARTFVEAAKSSERDPHSFTASSVGGCRREGAYKLAGTPVSDHPGQSQARASVLGTWIHREALPIYAAELGPAAEYERPVKVRVGGLELGGTMDIWDDPDVHDLKTCVDPGLHGLRRIGGLYTDHRIQFNVYGLGMYQEGNDVQNVAGMYLHRERGELEVVVEPFTKASVVGVVDRVTEIRHYAATNPDKAPQDGRGPGLSYACDGCAFLRRCWGDDAVPGVVGGQANRVVDDADREGALLALDDASARRSAASADYNFAKALLGRTKPGIYRSMSLRRGKAGEQLDQTAAAKLLREHDLPVPMRPKAGRLLQRPTEMLTNKMRQEIASYQVPDEAADSD